MHTYICEDCGATVEVEPYEGAYSYNEQYEQGLCFGCYERYLDAHSTVNEED